MKKTRLPSVTILLTVRNNASTITKCVKSLLNLNYPKFKIFITDSFSTDGTWEILRNLRKKHAKIRLERIKGNAPTALNYMIKKVNTKFVAFTDGDCVVDRNWLMELIAGFNSEMIVATAGFCGTPKKVNKLQKLIGKELEERFRRVRTFLLHAPTMNLCIRTKVAKKVRMDERLNVAYDTDLGLRLKKYGKIKYCPKAKVYHYHRPTWFSYLKQQFVQAKFVPLVYTKNWKIFFQNLFCQQKDPISNPLMTFQIELFFIACLLFIFSIFNSYFLFFGLAVFTILLISYLTYGVMLSKKLNEIVSFLILFFLRNMVWVMGIVSSFCCYALQGFAQKLKFKIKSKYNFL